MEPVGTVLRCIGFPFLSTTLAGTQDARVGILVTFRIENLHGVPSSVYSYPSEQRFDALLLCWFVWCCCGNCDEVSVGPCQRFYYGNGGVMWSYKVIYRTVTVA